MITMKGGYKTSANFHNMLNAGIINAGNTLFFKIKNVDNEKLKIPLKLYPQGVIEYSGNFFVDNEGLFILKIVDNKLSLPEYFKGLDETTSFEENN